MKILFDHQTFTHQDFGGISRYIYEVIKEFKSYKNLDTECPIIFSNNEYIKQRTLIPHTRFFPHLKMNVKVNLMVLLNQLKSIRVFKKADFDIFHPTYYDPYYIDFKTKKPIVITCLDLIHEKFIQHDLKTLSHKKKTLLRADKILAISQSTKNDLIDYYKLPADKITVTHLASSIKPAKNQVGSYPSDPYFLYVGTRRQYKNFVFFISAISPLVKAKSNLQVFCAGGDKFTKEELELFKELNILDKVRLESASDQNLQKLYSRATAFFYPSLYEGFGIPILEAMNSGCPVAASNVSSIPEVGGDAICYFDPLDKSSIYDVAKSLLEDEPLRQRLKEKGYQRAKKFSWKKTTEETYQSYLTLI
jgi:glycosyltransferase involved in cell wall biosynthesis